MSDISLILKYIIDYGNAGLLPNQDGNGGEVYEAALRIRKELDEVYEGISKIRVFQPERKKHG